MAVPGCRVPLQVGEGHRCFVGVRTIYLGWFLIVPSDESRGEMLGQGDVCACTGLGTPLWEVLALLIHSMCISYAPTVCGALD